MSKKPREKRKPEAEPGEPAEARKPLGLPLWVPAALFAGVTLWLFRAFVFSDQMLVGGDTQSLGYAARAYFADALRSYGSIPGWAPHILGGVPFLESLSGGDALYPPSLALLVLLETHRALGWKLVLHVALAGFLMFAWVRARGVSRAGALVAGLGYMLAPSFVSLVYPGHDGKMFVTALAPLLFLVVDRHFERPNARRFAGIALVVGLVLLTTHFQMAYFLFGATGAYAVFRAVTLHRAGAEGPAGASSSARRAVGRFGLFLVASVAGLGVASVQFLPAFEYVTESSRRVSTTREAAGETGIAWSSSWSMHPEEAMGLLVPEFPGANAGGAAWSSDTYWGRNFFKLNSEYIGLVLLVLAGLAFAGGSRPAEHWFFAGLGATALLFALGQTTPLWRIFYEVVPGVRLFRAPSQVIFLTAFSTATLAGFGVDRLLDAGRGEGSSGDRTLRVLWGAAAAAALLALLASSGALTGFWTSVVYPGIEPQRLAILESHLPAVTRGAGIAFLLLLALGGVGWGVRTGRLEAAPALAAVAVLVGVDEGRIAAPFVQTMDFHAWYEPDANLSALLERQAADPEPARLLSFFGGGQDVRGSMYGIDLAAGHHPNDLNRYRQLIGMVGSGVPDNLRTSDAIRRLLNVRYVLWPDYQYGPVQLGRVVSRLQFSSGAPHSTLFEVPGLARARLVGSAVVRGEADAVPYMLSEAFDPEREVVLPEEPPITLPGGPVEGTVEWIRRDPDHLELRVTSGSAALLTISDNWYPGWSATVDGEPAPVLRAYHTLRALPVEAGEHTVVLTFTSRRAGQGLLISTLLVLIVCSAAGFEWWRERARGEAP